MMVSSPSMKIIMAIHQPMTTQITMTSPTILMTMMTAMVNYPQMKIMTLTTIMPPMTHRIMIAITFQTTLMQTMKMVQQVTLIVMVSATKMKHQSVQTH